MSTWIQLDVGGKIFKTTVNTILSVPGTMLAKLCDPESTFGDQRQEGGSIMIDRDPEYFRVILNYLRTGQVFVDGNKVSIAGLLEEAKFYHIEPLEKELLSLYETSNITQRDFILYKEELRRNKLKGVKLNPMSLSGFDLSEFDFERGDISGSDFSHCKLKAGIFAKTTAIHTKFDEADMDKAEFQCANLEGCTFIKARMSHCLLQKAVLRGADFSNCYLKNAKFQGADLRGACFKGTDLRTVYFGGADLRQVKDFNWEQAEYCRRAIVTQEQYDALPNTLGLTPKENLHLCIAPVHGKLIELNYLLVKGTVAVDGTHLGAVVYSNPATANEIGLLFDGTKVIPVEDIEMVRERGIWYRKVEILPESEQDIPQRPNERRVSGWLNGIYLMRISTYV